MIFDHDCTNPPNFKNESCLCFAGCLQRTSGDPHVVVSSSTKTSFLTSARNKEQSTSWLPTSFPLSTPPSLQSKRWLRMVRTCLNWWKSCRQLEIPTFFFPPRFGRKCSKTRSMYKKCENVWKPKPIWISNGPQASKRIVPMSRLGRMNLTPKPRAATNRSSPSQSCCPRISARNETAGATTNNHRQVSWNAIYHIRKTCLYNMQRNKDSGLELCVLHRLLSFTTFEAFIAFLAFCSFFSSDFGNKLTHTTAPRGWT